MEKKSAPIPQLAPASFRLAEHNQIVYFATVEHTVTRENLLEPQFWAHVANHVRPFYEIRVRPEDDRFYATYIVVACDKNWVRVHEISFHDLTKSTVTKEAQAKIAEGYQIKFRGPKKWSAIRTADNAVLQEGMHTEADAQGWLKTHLSQQVPAAA